MTGIDDKRAGRRPGRRSALLFALGLLASLGTGAAVAVALVGRSVPARPERPLVVRVAPAARTVSPGSTATYMVKVARSNQRPIGLTGRTTLTVRPAGLPAGAEATFSAARPTGARLARRARTTLTITTAAETPPGTYRVRLGAARLHRHGSAVVELTVARPAGALPAGSPPRVEAPPADTSSLPPVAPVVPPLTSPDAFTIAGSLPGLLSPGAGAPLDLTLTNLEDADLLIDSLTVEVAIVSGPGTGPAAACDPESFAVEQFSGAPGFTLPAAGSADLAELGFGPSEWPVISMLNLPVNQDGCKGASLSLSFSGTASEAPR